MFHNRCPEVDLEELDRIGCQQMRESGWNERDIKDFMEACNGCYFVQ